MKKQVISSNNFKTKSPIMVTLVLYLCFDKWHVPYWIWGVVGTLLFIVLIASVIDFFNTKEIDIFNPEKK
jgi:hypothetical protein